MAKHPYEQYEGLPVWRVAERAFADLVANGDIKETTARTHIVGYMVKCLVDEGVIESSRKRDQLDKNDGRLS